MPDPEIRFRPDPRSSYWLAEAFLGDRLIGRAEYAKYAPDAPIMVIEISTEPAFRRRGVASRILAELLELYGAPLYVTAREDNAPEANALFAAFRRTHGRGAIAYLS